MIILFPTLENNIEICPGESPERYFMSDFEKLVVSFWVLFKGENFHSSSIALIYLGNKSV